MIFKDYYKILNITTDTSAQEIKQAFRQLAFRYHPDHNPRNTLEAEAKFKEINEAYEVLGDNFKRQQYDHLISLSDNPQSGKDNATEPVSVDEMLRKMAETGFIFRGNNHCGRGCHNRRFWQLHRQQWQE